VQKEDDTDASGIYSAFCVAYFAKRFTSSVRPMGSGVKIRHYGFEQHP
jgi:hypothetical protein